MDLPQITNPQLLILGQSLGASLQRNVVENKTVAAAFDDLLFELDLAKGFADPQPEESTRPLVGICPTGFARTMGRIRHAAAKSQRVWPIGAPRIA